MSTYTQILYQIVFSTKNREQTLEAENRKELFKYIFGILKNNKCHLYQIGGVNDHLHIVTHLHPSIALSDLIKDIKLASSKYMKSANLFLHFKGWQDGFAPTPAARMQYSFCSAAYCAIANNSRSLIFISLVVVGPCD